MDKNEIINNQYGEIRVNDRKKATLTGIKKLVSFNTNEFVMDSFLGGLVLKGSSLEIVKLDINEGILSIKGCVDAILYNDSSKTKESILTRLFK